MSWIARFLRMGWIALGHVASRLPIVALPMLESWVHSETGPIPPPQFQRGRLDRTREGQHGTPSRHDDQHRNLPGRHD